MMTVVTGRRVQSLGYAAVAVVVLGASTWVLSRVQVGDVDPLSAAIGALSLIVAVAALVVAARTWRWQQAGLRTWSCGWPRRSARWSSGVSSCSVATTGPSTWSSTSGQRPRAPTPQVLPAEADCGKSRPTITGCDHGGWLSPVRRGPTKPYWRSSWCWRWWSPGRPMVPCRCVCRPPPGTSVPGSRSSLPPPPGGWSGRLVDHLEDTYDLPKRQALVQAGRVLPVVDGLDELKAPTPWFRLAARTGAAGSQRLSAPPTRGGADRDLPQ